jgi:hypothetical protein
VADDAAARLTMSAMISNDDYRIALGTGAAEARERLDLLNAGPMRSLPNRSTPRNCAPWYIPP